METQWIQDVTAFGVSNMWIYNNSNAYRGGVCEGGPISAGLLLHKFAGDRDQENIRASGSTT